MCPSTWGARRSWRCAKPGSGEGAGSGRARPRRGGLSVAAPPEVTGPGQLWNTGHSKHFNTAFPFVTGKALSGGQAARAGAGEARGPGSRAAAQHPPHIASKSHTAKANIAQSSPPPSPQNHSLRPTKPKRRQKISPPQRRKQPNRIFLGLRGLILSKTSCAECSGSTLHTGLKETASYLQ